MRYHAIALVALLATGCTSGGGDDEREAPAPTPTITTPESNLLSDTEACAEVRQGIDAFNDGDLEETVRHFKAAVPLAKELVAEDDGAKPLLDAIEYYAALPPDQFMEASPSADFQRNKAITLTLCAYGGPTEEPTETGVPA